MEYDQEGKNRYDIQVSRNNSCYLSRKTSYLTCWGDLTDKTPKIPKNAQNNIISYSMGNNYMCAIVEHKYDLYCWGNNEYGQTDIPEVYKKSFSVGSGYYHNCAYTVKGTFGCWGRESSIDGVAIGVLYIPLDYIGFELFYTIGPFNNCLIKHVDKNGQDPKIETIMDPYVTIEMLHETYNYIIIKCLGSNKHGQIDLPAELNSHMISSDFQDLVAGVDHMCAITQNRIVCWGDNEYNQSSPPLNGGFRRYIWLEVNVGIFHNCALVLGGLVCWGSDLLGESTLPWLHSHHRLIASGGHHNCILMDNKDIKCWGMNDVGQCDVPRLKYK